MTRFKDEGTYLGQFLHTIFVVCPNCGERAVVRGDFYAWGASTVTCTACHFSEKRSPTSWKGPFRQAVSARCDYCGRKLNKMVSGTGYKPTASLDCSCGRKVVASLTFNFAVFGEPYDPFFGIELWLIESFKGHTLWIYNLEHLEFIRSYVGAQLREQAPGIGNRSLSTRLPQWMLDAKNRKQILKALKKLEMRI